jgi:membrane associated rhomboid family serine protease
VIPIRDVMPARTTPWISFGLLAVNGLVVAVSLAAAAGSPAPLAGARGAWPPAAALVVSLFVQPGGLQAGANVWALWLYGENVEDRLGHGRFLLFYAVAGAVGLVAHGLFSPASALAPTGASAAVAGVLGGYLALYPTGRVLALGAVPFRLELIEIPGGAPMVLWLLAQMVGGTGVFALLGGFALGAALVRFVARRERLRVEWWGA